MKNTSKFFVSISFFLLLFGCTTKIPNPPKLNNTPSNKVVISGVKFPDLNLRFSLTFATLNKDCRYQPTIVTPLISQVEHEVKLIPKGEFQFKIEFYLDKYLSGKCKWMPVVLSFSSNEYTLEKYHGSWSPIVYINNYQKADRDKKIKNSIKIDYKCSVSANKKSHWCSPKDKFLFSNGHPIVSEKGAAIKLIYKLKK